MVCLICVGMRCDNLEFLRKSEGADFGYIGLLQKAGGVLGTGVGRTWGSGASGLQKTQS